MGNEINYENLVYNTLSQEANLFINKKILSVLGPDLACFLAFLIDQSYTHRHNGDLYNEMFYASDMDIYLYTFIPRGRIPKIKNLGVEKNLYSIEKIGVPTRTYYKLNFKEILSIVAGNESPLELAYKRVFDFDPLQLTEETVKKLSFRDLRLLCKKLKVKYSGKDKKSDLTEKILLSQDLLNITLKSKVSGQTIEEISGQDLRKITVKKLRKMCKNSKISYNGNEGKDILIIKILEKLNTLEVDTSEQEKCSHTRPLISSVKKIIPIKSQWTKKVLTSEQEKCSNHDHDILNNHDINNHDHDNINNINLYNNFENLFKTFGINFTKTNQEAIKKLLKTNTPEEVKDYLKDNYENIKNTPSVKSIASVFCSLLAKGEKQPKPSNLRVFSPLPEELIKYEEIFKNFGISFTKSNQEAVRKLLKTLSHKQTENYLRETYENIANTPGVSDISSLFSSKIQKGERQLTAKERKNLNNNEIKIKTDKEKDKIQAEEFIKNLTKNSDIKIDFDSLTHEEQAEIEEEAMEICCKEIKTDKNFLLTMKKTNKFIYKNTINRYIDLVLRAKINKIN